MKIITRYILREFVKLWLLAVAALSSLVLISEFFRELRIYLDSKAGLFVILKFLLLSMPHWMMQAMPLATMLAVLFVLSKMEHRGEITAVKSSGINISIIINPLLMLGLAVAVAAVLAENTLIPYCSRRARAIKEEKILHREILPSADYYDLVTISPGREIYIARLDGATGRLLRVLVSYTDVSGRTRIIFAPQAMTDSRYWILSQAMLYSIGPDNVLSDINSEPALRLEMNINPRVMLPSALAGFNPEEMSFSDYKQVLENLRKLGLYRTKAWIQFYRKIFEPLTNFIVVLLALALSLTFTARASRLFNFTLAIVLAAGYWLVAAVGESLGELGLISAIMAASLGIIIFGVAAFFVLSRVRR